MASKIKLNMKWTDTGWARLYSNMMKDSAVHAAAGVVGPTAEMIHPLRDNVTIGGVAAMNEFGLGIPERSFIRRALLWSGKSKAEFMYLMGVVSHEVMSGVPRVIAMRKVGEWAVKRIKETILSNVPPVNAPETVDTKGHDHTLIHTGTLYDHIDFEIKKGIE